MSGEDSRYFEENMFGLSMHIETAFYFIIPSGETANLAEGPDGLGS